MFLTMNRVAPLTLMIALFGAISAPASHAQSLDLTWQVFARGLTRPVAIAHAGDERLFIIEQAGTIRIADLNGQVLSEPFLDLRDRVDSRGNEMGLLGLAFAPDYQNTGYFFVNYTRDDALRGMVTRIARFTRSAERNRADGSSEQVILEYDQPYSNHNGGDLHFGPDGMLYIASGDGGSGGDPENHAQSTQALLGKLLRIDVSTPPGATDGPDCGPSGSSHYRIPPDNPFADGAGGDCDEIAALGLRNPWRFSFDHTLGDLWIGDVGQNAYEEIDHVPAADRLGHNFGWRCYEGDAVYRNAGCTIVSTPPIAVFSHSDGYCSITGGHVYRGARLPALYGQYLFSDYCAGTLHALTPNEPTPRTLLVERVGAPVAFGEDRNGETYLASLNAGIVYRLVDETVVRNDFEPSTIPE